MSSRLYRSPTTELEAKFSLEFCVAHALSRGRVNQAAFDGSAWKAPEVPALMEKVRIQVDDRVRHNSEWGQQSLFMRT